MKLTFKNVVLSAVIGAVTVAVYEKGEELGIPEAVSQYGRDLFTRNLYGELLSDRAEQIRLGLYGRPGSPDSVTQLLTPNPSDPLEAQIKARKAQASDRQIRTKALRVMEHLAPERQYLSSRGKASNGGWEQEYKNGVFSILYRRHGQKNPKILTIMSTDGDPQYGVRVGMKVEVQNAAKTDWYPAEIVRIVAELGGREVLAVGSFNAPMLKNWVVELDVEFTESTGLPGRLVSRTTKELRACKPKKVFRCRTNGRGWNITAYAPGAWEAVLDGLQFTVDDAVERKAKQEQAKQQAKKAKALVDAKTAFGL